MWIGDKYIDTDDIKDALLIMWALVIGGIVVGNAIHDHQFNKEKEELAQTLAQDLNYASVDVKNFDWFLTDDNEHLFKFTGSATNSMNEKIDFFACSYEVSETQFNDMIDYMSNIKVKDVREIENLGLLKKINDIVKEAELVSNKENVSVVTPTSEESVILNVSKAKVNGDKVSYYIAYATPTRDKNGNLGIKKTLTEVSYDLTPELEKHPNGVFLLARENAKTKVLDVKNTSLDVFQLQMFNDVNESRKKI